MLRLIALLVLCPSLAIAGTLLEPDKNTDGTPLDDLESCTVVVTEVRSGTTGSQVFPASSPAGGGTHAYDAGSILPTGIRELTATAICSDTSGNGSELSNTVSTFRPDGLAPAAPALVE